MGRIELSYDWNWAWYSAGGSLFRVRGLETGVYDTMLRHPWNGNFIPLNPGDPVQNGMITDAIPNPSGGQVITSIKQDPKDPNHLLLTVGNYGANAYIFETNNALDTVNPVTWTSIHGNLPDMPVYDVAMLPEKPQVLIAGTELGVYVSENGGATWTENNSGMCRVPVFQVRVYQNNTWSGPEVYIGTHGRGMFKATNLLTGIARQNTEPATDLRVYPNPAADQSLLQFTLGKASAVTIRVADLSGKTVFTGSYQLAGGQHQLPLQVATWPAGNYIVTLQSNQSRQCRKLLVTH